jgi:hypothetical protein
VNKTFRLPVGALRKTIESHAIDFIHGLSAAKAWRVTIEPDTNIRSHRQNRYHFGVVVKMLSDFTGYETKDIHEFLCGEHWGWKEKRVPRSPNFPSGVCVIPVRTTTHDEDGNSDTLDKKRFYEFVEFCQRFGASKGIVIPDPEPWT